MKESQITARRLVDTESLLKTLHGTETTVHLGTVLKPFPLHFFFPQSPPQPLHNKETTGPYYALSEMCNLAFCFKNQIHRDLFSHWIKKEGMLLTQDMLVIEVQHMKKLH